MKVCTIHDVLFDGPLLDWAKELDIDLSLPCNWVTIACVPTGGPDDPNWQQCRPLEFFTGPYLDWEKGAGNDGYSTDVWLFVEVEEAGVLMLNGEPKVGFWCSRGEVNRLELDEMKGICDGHMAVIPSHLSVPVPGDTLTKPIYE